MRSVLTARRVTGHPQATNAYRVVWNGIEIGSIGLQIGADQREYWSWGIDTVLPRQLFATHGECESREDAMAAFRRAWDHFTANTDRLQAFLAARR